MGIQGPQDTQSTQRTIKFFVLLRGAERDATQRDLSFYISIDHNPAESQKEARKYPLRRGEPNSWRALPNLKR